MSRVGAVKAVQDDVKAELYALVVAPKRTLSPVEVVIEVLEQDDALARYLCEHQQQVVIRPVGV